MSPRRVAVLFFVGTILLQAAWILAVPPYRGSDEFDHAYRADAVAHGQWEAVSEQAPHGRGGLLEVRRSVVNSASAMCDSYEYAGRDNCFPAGRADHDRVLVASAASANHPLVYWLMGTPARLVSDGYGALTVMRSVSAVLSSLLLALAAYLLALQSSTGWPVRALGLSATPVLIYSTTVAAPNGVELCAGIATWAALLALGNGSLPPNRVRFALVSAIVAALAIVIPRQLGPLWLALIVGTCLVIFGAHRWLVLARTNLRLVSTGAVLVALAATGNVLWVRSAGTLGLGEVQELDSRLGITASQIPLWVLQSIAAFPLRDESAHPAVYACYLAVGIGLLCCAWCLGSRRWRQGIVLASCLSVGVPSLITFFTVEANGTIWQGRYGLPYSVGVVLLAGIALDHRPPSHRLVGPAQVGFGLAVVLAHAVSVVGVQQMEEQNPVALAGGSWPWVPAWVIALLAIAATVLWGLSGMHGPGRSSGRTDAEQRVATPVRS